MKKTSKREKHRSRLTPVKFVEYHTFPSGKRLAKWLYNCECGNTKIIIQQSVKQNKTFSCGCLLAETSRSKLPKMNEARKWAPHSGFQKGNEAWKKRKNYNKSETSKSKGLIRVYESHNKNKLTDKHCYLTKEQFNYIYEVGIIPPEIRSKLSICERTGNFIIH